MAVQILGGVAGTIAAHLMFALPILDASLKRFGPVVRSGSPSGRCLWTGAHDPRRPSLCAYRRAWLVGLYITAAYWFTASTSFANPAVAIARSLTNTFSGIRPQDLPAFIAAELLGAVCALAVMRWLLQPSERVKAPLKATAEL